MNINFEINLKVNNLALEMWDDEASRCTFYTVKRDDEIVIDERGRRLVYYNGDDEIIL